MTDKPNEPTSEEVEKRKLTWAEETMLAINKLTPDIKGKAFDPDWFLLRERLEEFEARQSAAVAQAQQAAVAATLRQAEKVAMTTEFRAHSESDENFHSGCVQTRDRIVGAIRSLRPDVAAWLAAHDAEIVKDTYAKLDNSSWVARVKAEARLHDNEIGPQLYKLMDGLDVHFAPDGTWLWFKASNGNSAVIRLESLADASGHITGTAIQQWSVDQRARLSGATTPAGEPK
jgi:hypothetical protein